MQEKTDVVVGQLPFQVLRNQHELIIVHPYSAVVTGMFNDGRGIELIDVGVGSPPTLESVRFLHLHAVQQWPE